MVLGSLALGVEKIQVWDGIAQDYKKKKSQSLIERLEKHSSVPICVASRIFFSLLL